MKKKKKKKNKGLKNILNVINIFIHQKKFLYGKLLYSHFFIYYIINYHE